ncbi:MAG: ion transporter [Gammaproteobacteria bacterium]|nr:ion transporter [Gammaproteobacteria bacterium]
MEPVEDTPARATLRARAWVHLESPSGAQRGISRFNRVVIWMILASSVMVILETEKTLVASLPLVFLAGEIIFATMFTFEYLLRTWAAGEHPQGRWHYLTRPSSLFDLLALASFYAPFLPVSGALLRLIRLARILRLARLGQFSVALQNLTFALSARRFELMLSLVIAFTLMLFSSTLLYLVEGRAQPDAFGSIPRALWWSVATLTTVGYGDVIPGSGLGKMLAGLTALSGIGVIAMPAGIVASALTEVLRSRRLQSGEDTRD